MGATNVGVIGAGLSGMTMGLRLQEAGVPFTIFEKGSDVGGTWRENRYPGLTIDVPSPLYTFSGHRNPDWRRWMPDHTEILDYFRDVADVSGLREKIQFDNGVTAATWTGSDWKVETVNGDVAHFGVLVCASGFLHHPRIPEIEGLSSFRGELVHSARWRDDTVIEGRRIGVIGNGSTGVQLTGELAGKASHLTMFSRTPQWILPLPNFDMPGPVRGLLSKVRALNDPLVESLLWVADWFVGGASIHDDARRHVIQRVAAAYLNTVKDPELRAKLTPPDTVLCKRPVVSSTFYRAVQRDDVDFVTDAIERVVPGGIVTADGTTHELDLLIFATGFEAHNYMRPIRIRGEGGLTLDDAWAGGPHGYRTVSLTGFPNLFMIMGPHSPLNTISIHESAELQSDYVIQMLDIIGREDVVSVQPRASATERWLAHIRAGMPGTVWSSGCTSWYLMDGETPVLWPYDRREWRKTLRTPELSDYEVRKVEVTA